ncbi:NADH-ubiquinone oxidoreductase-F iron-sulfur binding region domain-containing protein [Xanthomonas campestris]|uniref:NADH-ubiquinone oxidoreductase-F iron-sulfur binding region domain-containing protein n=1 Tax=Xanthomonas campestris TaxID=339 RepID=UPI001E2E1B76|nr:NADH-ubiquinone oxidoreductase-F iron-sulfur binding region domain-containing protein [Xanthomonas campestris]MCC4602290.1 SLBB domain-containing protein [Xanthomonas campestris pv. parthenii]
MDWNNGQTSHEVILEGRLLKDLAHGGGKGLEGYLVAGGYATLSQVLTEGAEIALARLAGSGLRGRAGGGFPTAVKWGLVRKINSAEKYFVCNANTGQPGGGKEGVLIGLNPHRVIEAVVLAANVVGAKIAFIHLGSSLEHEQQLLQQALQEAMSAGYLDMQGQIVDVRIHRSEDGYIAGEETALIELLEGRPCRPRGKPTMPTHAGFEKRPTAVNNIETVLQAFFAIKYGPEHFREIGTKYASGTLIYCITGDIARPGIYELPLGIRLGELINEHAGGVAGGHAFKAALVGGTSGTALGLDQLDTPLDYDNLAEKAGSLGSGVIIVISSQSSMVGVARNLAKFYYETSCGKCQPCKDGTRRALYMLDHLDRIDESAVDWSAAEPPSSKGIPMLLVNTASTERASISYTDSGTGLDKIRLICNWYSTRGDCNHSMESSRMLQSLLDGYVEEFENERHLRWPDEEPTLPAISES